MCGCSLQIFVEDILDRTDLMTVVCQQLADFPPGSPNDDIVSFYLKAKELSRTILLDGAHLRPQYSLRTLCRALSIAKELHRMRHAPIVALYEVHRQALIERCRAVMSAAPPLLYGIPSPPAHVVHTV